jgi:simple sugar transport system permease protein
MGYFALLMLVFLIGAPEAWMRPNLHQSVFVMMPTLIFLTLPLVFLVASGEIDLSFASTYAVAAYVFAIMAKSGIDPALSILAGLLTGTAIGGLVGALIVVFRLSSLVASLGVLFLLRGIILLLTNSRSITLLEIDSHWIYPVLGRKILWLPYANILGSDFCNLLLLFIHKTCFWSSHTSRWRQLSKCRANGNKCKCCKN